MREAHSLSLEEARRGYPVHVQATVTYYDNYLDPRRIAFFLHDSTGSVFAAVLLGTTWQSRRRSRERWSTSPASARPATTRPSSTARGSPSSAIHACRPMLDRSPCPTC